MFRQWKKRWNCPSDRELVLRAKLNSGWCVHSGDYFFKPEPILEPELLFIEEVIQRAKKLDSLEKERIGRMVCRLENMKRNTVGDGKKTCSMCGSSFGFLRNSSVCCTDCNMAVCEKCRIDLRNGCQEVYILCKICAENREIWKKSGGWFYGSIPTTYKSNLLSPRYSLKAGSPKCSRAFTTWEHRKPDIVRLQSFEPPASRNGKTFYTNWAVNSSPDLNSMDELSDDEVEYVRKKSIHCNTLEMHHLSVASNYGKLSASCPTLQILEVEEESVPEEIPYHPKKHSPSKKKNFTKKAMKKIMGHHNS